MGIETTTRRAIVLAGLLTVTSSLPAHAGGLFGDLINNIVPGAGTALDDAHRQIKNAVPPYKAIEEGGSRIVSEGLSQAGAPALQELIARSRDDALRAGVQPIPMEIRQNLKGFIASHLLDIVRYRVKGGGDLTLQVNSIRYGEAKAIALDYVVVFKDANDALYNSALWAHELTHIDQYQRWGIQRFAIEYLRNYHSVEREAYEADTRYVAWASVQNAERWSSTGQTPTAQGMNRPVSPFSFNSNSNMCSTPFGGCQLGETAPVGTGCWCNTRNGPATGSLIPTLSGPSPRDRRGRASYGLPSGHGMQVCGCWGPNPSPNAAEPRCESGAVRVNVCPGFCAPGHPLYAYICQ